MKKVTLGNACGQVKTNVIEHHALTLEVNHILCNKVPGCEGSRKHVSIRLDIEVRSSKEFSSRKCSTKQRASRKAVLAFFCSQIKHSLSFCHSLAGQLCGVRPLKEENCLTRKDPNKMKIEGIDKSFDIPIRPASV